MGRDFKSSVGKPVPASEADKWIADYDEHCRPDKAVDTKKIFYGRDALLRLLSTEGSTGITFALALKPTEADPKKKVVQLVLYATAEDGSYLNPSNGSGSVSGESAAKVMDATDPYDKGMSCPPYCP